MDEDIIACTCETFPDAACPHHWHLKPLAAAVPSVVPPPEWGKPYKMAKGWGIDAACDCQISVEDSQPGLPFVAPCEQHSKHSLGALDSGLALLRGALAQQEKE